MFLKIKEILKYSIKKTLYKTIFFRASYFHSVLTINEKNL